MPDLEAITNAVRKARFDLAFAEQVQKTREAVLQAGLDEPAVVLVDEVSVLMASCDEQPALPPAEAPKSPAMGGKDGSHDG